MLDFHWTSNFAPLTSFVRWWKNGFVARFACGRFVVFARVFVRVYVSQIVYVSCSLLLLLTPFFFRVLLSFVVVLLAKTRCFRWFAHVFVAGFDCVCLRRFALYFSLLIVSLARDMLHLNVVFFSLSFQFVLLPF